MDDGKRCSRCRRVKDKSEFCRAKVNKDGLSGQCRPCRTEIQRSRRTQDPSYAERQREVIRRRRAEGRRAPSEALKPKRFPPAGSEEWRQRRVWSGRLSSAKTNARRFGVQINDLSLADWLVVVGAFGRRCSYCNAAADLEIDHVVPLSGGGQNTKSNVVPACKSCNSSKSVKSREQFIAGLCRNDHPITPENTYVFPNGKRACRPCVRAARARSVARKRARESALADVA